jgi:hypothetical protein
VQQLRAQLCITRNVKPYKIDIYPQGDGILPVFAQRLHNAGAPGKMMTANQIIVLTVERDGRILPRGKKFSGGKRLAEEIPTLAKDARHGEPFLFSPFHRFPLCTLWSSDV